MFIINECNILILNILESKHRCELITRETKTISLTAAYEAKCKKTNIQGYAPTYPISTLKNSEHNQHTITGSLLFH